MKKTTALFVFVFSFSITAFTQNTQKSYSLDSARRECVIHKIIKLADEIRGLNDSAATALYQVAISVKMKKEGFLATQSQRIVNSALRAKIDWIIKERKAIDSLERILLHPEKQP